MSATSKRESPGRRKPGPTPPHHRVYVIELAPQALASRRMQVANPDHRPDRPALYVGQTGHTPEERFQKHRSGVKANAFVRDHGVRLRPDLYEHLPAFPWLRSLVEEKRLAEALRAQGYAVWSR